MTQLCIELPEALPAVLQCSADELDRELRLAAAAQWCQVGRICQEWAAKIARLDCTDFLLVLTRLGKDCFQFDFPDLQPGAWSSISARHLRSEGLEQARGLDPAARLTYHTRQRRGNERIGRRLRSGADFGRTPTQ